MRVSVAALSLIIRPLPQGGTAWLAQWNHKWGRLNLVGGHKRPGESFRECCIREVAEELDLAAERDFVVAPEPLARVEFNAHSASADTDTRYTFELYRVELVDPDVPLAGKNRWLTEGEIAEGRSADGLPTSETVTRLLSAVTRRA